MTASKPFVIVSAMLAVVLSGSARAQLSPWSSLPAAPAQSVQIEQSLMVVTQGHAVHAFSAITKTWTSIGTVFGAPAITLANEHLVVRDGPMFHGYSPRTGSFQSVFASSPTPTVVSASSPQTWHTIVIDGMFLHVFFALSGQWATFAFPSPPVVTSAMNGRFCFLVSCGATVFGVSSFQGSLVPTPAAALALGAWGNVAIATSAGAVLGFSASRGTWASMPVAGTPTVTTGNAQPAFVAINDGVSLSMFSGHSGAFTTLPVSAAATLHLERYVAIAVEGTNVVGYSALVGTCSSLVSAVTPTIVKQQAYALLDDGSSVTAYSAAKAAFGTAIPRNAMTLVTKAQVAALTPAGWGVPSLVYSAYRNEWIAGPGFSSGTTYLTAASAVVEADGGGLWGWSQRGATWIHQPAQVMDVIVAGTSAPGLAETLFARAANTMYAFNPRTEAWRTTTTASQATLVRAHHAVILAQDGTAAYGFNIWDDRWTSVSLQYATGGGQAQAAWATDGTTIWAYGGFGPLAMIGEFPDFYRAATIGSRLSLGISGEPGSWTLLGVSFSGASIPMPPYGTLLLDPATLLVIANFVIPPSKVCALVIPIPDDPSLSGLTPHFQAAVGGPTGTYLTNSVFPTIY